MLEHSGVDMHKTMRLHGDNATAELKNVTVAEAGSFPDSCSMKCWSLCAAWVNPAETLTKGFPK